MIDCSHFEDENIEAIASIKLRLKALSEVTASGKL